MQRRHNNFGNDLLPTFTAWIIIIRCDALPLQKVLISGGNWWLQALQSPQQTTLGWWREMGWQCSKIIPTSRDPNVKCCGSITPPASPPPPPDTNCQSSAVSRFTLWWCWEVLGPPGSPGCLNEHWSIHLIISHG